MKVRAVFLDRDGVINEYPGDREYVKSWKEFHFLPYVKPALKKLCEKGYKLFIVSNQAGVSKGLYSQRELDDLTEKMRQELSASGVALEGVYYCTHREEDACACRKPKSGLVEAAISRLKSQGQDLDRSASFFIGDTIRDVKTGRAARLKTILVFSGKEKPQNSVAWEVLPDYTAADLREAAALISE